MMNPSIANKNESDNTTNMIISWINNNMEFKEIETINVIPTIEKKSHKIRHYDFKISACQKNLDYIESLITNINSKKEAIIIATGQMTPKLKHKKNKCSANRASFLESLYKKNFYEQYYKIINIIYNYNNQNNNSLSIYRIGEFINNKKDGNLSRHPSGINLGEKFQTTQVVIPNSKKYKYNLI